MRQNLLIFALLGAVCLFSLFCSRTDVVTGAGGSVVTGMNPELTDLDGGFKRIDLNSREIDGLAYGFSLPESADPTFGTTLLVTTERLPVGLNADGDTVAAHVQFRAQGFGGSNPPYGRHDEDGLAAYLYFRAVDTEGAGEPIPVSLSDTLQITEVRPVSRNSVGAACDEEPCAVTLSGEGEIDSMRLTDEVAQMLFRARVSNDTSVSFSVAYGIIDYYGPLRVIGVPHLVIHVTKSGSTVRDTLPRAARFTAFERDAEKRAEFAYSSFHTKRTAVFEVDVRGIIDSIKAIERSFGVRSEVLNAVVSVRYTPRDGDDGDAESEPSPNGDSDEDYIPVTRNPAGYRMIALDRLLTKDTDIDTTVAALSREFGRGQVRTTEPATAGKSNMFSIKAALQSAIDNGSDRIYVYLRPVAENGMMMWDKPQAIETVFILSR